MRRPILVAVLGGAVVALGYTATRADARWPEGPVRSLPLPSTGASLRVFLDAGHGAPGNAGNLSAFCEPEQDFTLALVEDVAGGLERLGGFEIATSRGPGELVDYQKRVRDAEAWGADVFVSLHSDVRGEGERWSPSAGAECLRSHAAPGFSVIVSDEGGARGVALARATSRWMNAAGFSPFDGDYGAIYARDALGVFLDRHAPDERIFVLWRPSMPAILIETHHALDDREVRRWREPAVREAFTHALAAAIIEAVPR
jgi:N-acetylmuramoyl-L-alanine amidase